MPKEVHGNYHSGRVVKIRRNIFKSSAKLDALMRHLSHVRSTEAGTKSVVFSQFTGMLDLIEVILERDGFKFLRLDGTHSQASREHTLTAFKAPDHPATVMLISLRAGGVGLNLTAASRVYMMVRVFCIFTNVEELPPQQVAYQTLGCSRFILHQ